jgi:hypothetical protein
MHLGAEPYMDASRRNDVLAQISSGRAKEARVLEVLQSLPAWAETPFQVDQVAFESALRTYQAAEPVVRNIESRLVTTPGPIWKELTPEEVTALSNWSKSLDQLYAFTNTYFPSESQQYIGQVALLAIAVGAFLAPIFLDEPEKGLTLPFDIEPPKFPTSPRRPRASMPPPSAPQTAMPVFTPTSFSRIPGTTIGPSTPLRVQAEVMRPAASAPPTPWRRPEAPVGGAAPAAPGYRTFTRPLGPETPISRIQTPAEAARAAVNPTAAAPGPHGPPTFPRFRRQ